MSQFEKILSEIEGNTERFIAELNRSHEILDIIECQIDEFLNVDVCRQGVAVIAKGDS